MVSPQTKQISLVHLLRERGRCGSLPLSLLRLRDALQGTRQHGRPLLFAPVQTHKLPLWQVSLDAIIGGVALCAEAFDKGLGLFNIREAHELAPQLDATLLAVNAASSL